MKSTDRIFIAGRYGMVGRALERQLRRYGFNDIVGFSRGTYDLRSRSQVHTFFHAQAPTHVFLVAAKVGGIMANANQSGEFIRDNLLIQTNVIDAAKEHDVKRLMFFSSACAYPKHATCPISETAFMTGPLEPTNQAYATAKLAGMEMCRAYESQYGCDFFSVVPTNLYGTGDHYDLENSHVLPGMIRRFHEAKVSGSSFVTLWGTGRPTREFLFADDLAEAAIGLMKLPQVVWPTINISSGHEVTLAALACIVRDIVAPGMEIRWDSTKPDGTPRRALENSRILSTGWRPAYQLDLGVQIAYEDFKRHHV